MVSSIEREGECPKEDLRYLVRKELVEAYMEDVLDESKSPLIRLLSTGKVLSYTKNYEERFAQVITDVRGKREELKELLGVF